MQANFAVKIASRQCPTMPAFFSIFPMTADNKIPAISLALRGCFLVKASPQKTDTDTRNYDLEPKTSVFESACVTRPGCLNHR